MLKNVQRLAQRLAAKGVRYCAYKSIESLELDVSGDRGDLDILLDAADQAGAGAVFRECGFRRVLWPPAVGGVSVHSGYDRDSGKYLQLHVYTRLRIGDRANKQIRWRIEEQIIERAVVDSRFGLQVILPADEFAVLLVRLLLKNKRKQIDVDRLADLAQMLAAKDVELPLAAELAEICGLNAGEILGQLKSSADFDSVVELYRPRAVKYFSAGLANRAKSVYFSVLVKAIKLYSTVRHRLGFPSCKIRRLGSLYVLVGVDGSGKSTQIDALVAHPYLRMTGVRGLYFGENQYWIPGLSRILTAHASKSRRRSITVLLLQSFAALDRRLRVAVAWMAMLQGRHVIGDRYYYDDLMKVAQQESGSSWRWGLYLSLVYGWLGTEPRRTFFLDVDSEVAYSRKQDFEFSKLDDNVNTYRELLCGRNEVEVLDATQPPEVITRLIVGSILQPGEVPATGQ